MNIFNVDETGQCCDQGQKLVFCAPEDSRVDSLTSESTKTMYTVQVCVGAYGQFLPLMVLYKAKNLDSSWIVNGPENCYYNVFDSGWMEVEPLEV